MKAQRSGRLLRFVTPKPGFDPSFFLSRLLPFEPIFPPPLVLLLRSEAGLSAKRTGTRERRPERGKKELSPDTSESNKTTKEIMFSTQSQASKWRGGKGLHYLKMILNTYS